MWQKDRNGALLCNFQRGRADRRTRGARPKTRPKSESKAHSILSERWCQFRTHSTATLIAEEEVSEQAGVYGRRSGYVPASPKCTAIFSAEER